MAAELSASRQELERSTLDLRRQHQEVEARRRYIETILDRITTGVISLDAAGRVTTVNRAAAPAARPGRGDDRPAGGGAVRAARICSRSRRS